MSNKSTSDVHLPPESDDPLGILLLKGIGIFISITAVTFIGYLAVEFLGVWSSIVASAFVVVLVGYLFSDDDGILNLTLVLFVALPLLLLLLSLPDL